MAERKIRYKEDESFSPSIGSITTTYGNPRNEYLKRIGNYALLGTGIVDRLRVDPKMRPYMSEMNKILTINPYELGLPSAFPTYDVGDNRFYKNAFIPVGEKGSINYGYDYDVDEDEFGLNFLFSTPFNLLSGGN